VTFVAVDHLIVAAASLDDGVRWCEATLGVTPGAGRQARCSWARTTGC
jgi:hypothetical protein